MNASELLAESCQHHLAIYASEGADRVRVRDLVYASNLTLEMTLRGILARIYSDGIQEQLRSILSELDGLNSHAALLADREKSALSISPESVRTQYEDLEGKLLSLREDPH